MSVASIPVGEKNTPKTNITFDVETGGKITKTVLPFKIGIILEADSTDTKSLTDLTWITVQPGNDVALIVQQLNLSEACRCDLSHFLGNVMNIPLLEVHVMSRSRADFERDLTENTDACELYMGKAFDGIGFNLLIADLYFTDNAEDTLLLQKISALAENFQVPFIAATHNVQISTAIPYVLLQAPVADSSYQNPVFLLAENVVSYFDRYAWPIVSEQPLLFSYLLIACRFAQYIKKIMRNKIGSFPTRSNIESFLNNWISHYKLLDDQAPLEIQAVYPLKNAAIVIEEVAGTPGAYHAVLFIQPQFLIPAPAAFIRLAFVLPNS